MPKEEVNQAGWEDGEDLFMDDYEGESVEESSTSSEDDEDPSSTSYDEYQIVNANGEVVEGGFMPKKIASVNSKSPIATADEYYAFYPQDRRSRDEINTILTKTIDYLKKLGGNGVGNKSELKRAAIVAVHVDFLARIEKIPLV